MQNNLKIPGRITLFPWETMFARNTIVRYQNALPRTTYYRIIIPSEITPLFFEKQPDFGEIKMILFSEEHYLYAKQAEALPEYFLDCKNVALNILSERVHSLSKDTKETQAYIFCPDEVACDFVHCFDKDIDAVTAEIFTPQKRETWIPLKMTFRFDRGIFHADFYHVNTYELVSPL